MKKECKISVPFRNHTWDTDGRTPRTGSRAGKTDGCGVCFSVHAENIQGFPREKSISEAHLDSDRLENGWK